MTKKKRSLKELVEEFKRQIVPGPIKEEETLKLTNGSKKAVIQFGNRCSKGQVPAISFLAIEKKYRHIYLKNRK